MLDGLGVYKWRDGSVYRGEWRGNYMNGCGRKVFPGNIVEEGEWVTDMFAGDFSSCDVPTARATARKAEQVASESRMFMLKPEGAVKKSEGVEIDQHPVRYASGNEHLMPGPAGQLFDVPDDEKERERMRKHAKQAKRIFDRYNIAMPSQSELKRISRERELAYEEQLQRERKAAEEAITVRDERDEEEDEEEDEEGQRQQRAAGKSKLKLPPMPFRRRGKQQEQQESAAALSTKQARAEESEEQVINEDEDDEDEDEDEDDDEQSRGGGRGLFGRKQGRHSSNNTACMSVAVAGAFRPMMKRARRLPRLRPLRINESSYTTHWY